MTRVTLLLCIVSGLACLTTTAHAQQQSASLSFVGAETIRKYDDMQQYGLRFRQPLEQRSRWMPGTLDITAGAFLASDKTASYVSFGPSWQHRSMRRNGLGWFMDYGLHPTLISRTSFDGTRIGGSFHFTSHFGIGAYLTRDRQASLALRYQHTSNGGIRSRNPGIDMVAVVFRQDFDGSASPIFAAR